MASAAGTNGSSRDQEVARELQFVKALSHNVGAHVDEASLVSYLTSAVAVLPSSSFRDGLQQRLSRYANGFVAAVKRHRAKQHKRGKQRGTAAQLSATPADLQVLAPHTAATAMESDVALHSRLVVQPNVSGEVAVALLQRHGKAATAGASAASPLRAAQAALGEAATCLRLRTDSRTDLEVHMQRFVDAVDELLADSASWSATTLQEGAAAVGAALATCRARMAGADGDAATCASPAALALVRQHVLMQVALARQLYKDNAAAAPTLDSVVANVMATTAIAAGQRRDALLELATSVVPLLRKDNRFRDHSGVPENQRIASAVALALQGCCLRAFATAKSGCSSAWQFLQVCGVLRAARHIAEKDTSGTGRYVDLLQRLSAIADGLRCPAGVQQWFDSMATVSPVGSKDHTMFTTLAQAPPTATAVCREATVSRKAFKRIMALAATGLQTAMRQAGEGSDEGDSDGSDGASVGSGDDDDAEGDADVDAAPLFFIDTRGNERKRSRAAMMAARSTTATSDGADDANDADDGEGHATEQLMQELSADLANLPQAAKETHAGTTLSSAGTGAGAGAGVGVADDLGASGASAASSDSRAGTGGVSITDLDLIKDTVCVANHTNEPVSLAGWKLLSETGDQSYEFPEDATLDAGESVTVRSGASAPRRPRKGELFWTKRYVWNNHGDTAVLMHPSGKRVSTVTQTGSEEASEKQKRKPATARRKRRSSSAASATSESEAGAAPAAQAPAVTPSKGVSKRSLRSTRKKAKR